MNQAAALDLKQFVRDIPDFPQPGVMFRDITPLLASPVAFGQCIRRLADHFRHHQVDVVVAAEARGFLFGAPLALELRAAFVPIRKQGKLPYRTLAHQYELEYGSDTLEVHADAILPGQRVLVVDDVLATGGTVAACYQLLGDTGAHVLGCAVAIELLYLHGAQRIADHELFSLIQYA